MRHTRFASSRLTKTKNSEATLRARLAAATLADPHPVYRLVRALDRAGGRALIVGGWVRDVCLGESAKDIDLEVFGLENMKNLPTLRELDEMAREQGLLQQASEDALAPAASSLAVEGDTEAETVAPEESAEDSAADSSETELDDEASTMTEQDPEIVEGAGVVEVAEVVGEIEAVDVASDDRPDDVDEDPAER